MRFKISHHAEEEIERRKIPLFLLKSVLEKPQQVITEKRDRKVYQSQLDFGEGKIFLLRAIIDDQVEPAVVITVYRTSKIEKYWRLS